MMEAVGALMVVVMHSSIWVSSLIGIYARQCAAGEADRKGMQCKRIGRKGRMDWWGREDHQK